MASPLITGDTNRLIPGIGPGRRINVGQTKEDLARAQVQSALTWTMELVSGQATFLRSSSRRHDIFD